MPDLAVYYDTEIFAKVKKAEEILMIFKVYTYGEQTVDMQTVQENLVQLFSNVFQPSTVRKVFGG